MAYFHCDLAKITAEQMAVINSVESLFREQSINLTVTSIKPITVELKANLTDIMIQRLFIDRVPYAAQGYIGVKEDGNLVIQKKETDKPAPKPRKARSKRNADLQQLDSLPVVEQDII